METLSYIFGIIGICFWASSIQCKEKRKILISQIIANIFVGMQYFCIGAMTSGYISLLGILRTYIYSREKEKNSIYSVLTFSISIILIGLITYENWLSCIPTFAGLIYTYITWQKDTKVIRIGFFIAGIILLYYNYIVGAYVAVIGNVFEIMSSIISIYRFDVTKKQDKQLTEIEKSDMLVGN